MEERLEENSLAGRTTQAASVVGGMILLMWGLEVLDWLMPGDPLDHWGIVPRTWGGFLRIPLAPFLHGGFVHLISNTLPLAVLGGIIMLRSAAEFFSVTTIVVLAAGLGTWLIGGSNTVHLGASSLVFGYFGFLLLRAWFDRSILSLLIGVAVFFVYGGIIWGVLPLTFGVSWEGHLCGLLGGVLAARIISQTNNANTVRKNS